MNEEIEVGNRELEILELNKKADNAVSVAAAAAAATGAVPIPFADAPLLIGEQVAMMVTICGIYGINISKDGLKMLATAAIGTGGATLLGKTIATNLLKLIPGAGSVAGGAVSAGTAGVVTLAMGKAFIKVCNLVKVGKLSEEDLASKKGREEIAAEFKEQMKKIKIDKKAGKKKNTKNMLNIPKEYKTSNVGKPPKDAQIPAGMTLYGMGTEGTGVLLSHWITDESAALPFNDNQRIIDGMHKQFSSEENSMYVVHPKSWTRYCFLYGRTSELRRSSSVQFNLDSYRVVVADIFIDCIHEFLDVLVFGFLAVKHLTFQYSKEVLHKAIIHTVSFSGHALYDSVLFQTINITFMLILPALIRVKYCAFEIRIRLIRFIQHIVYLIQIW